MFSFPKPTEITWKYPGDLSLRYSGDPKSRVRWFLVTLKAGFAMWRIWLHIACWLYAVEGKVDPNEVSGVSSHYLAAELEELGYAPTIY